MLPLAMHIPDESHIHLVGGRPVLTFWGFELLTAAPGGHVIRDLSLASAAAPVATAAAVAAVPLVAASRNWGCLRWLLLPLLLLLLLLFLLFGLNSCSVPLPAWVASVPGASLILPQVQGPDGSIPGVVVPGAVVPGGAVVGPDGQVVPPAGTDGAVKPPQSEAKDEKDKPQDKQDKTEPPVPPHPDQKDQKDPKDKSADAKTPPPVVPPHPDKPPLTIPDEAAKNGSTAFLNGRWHSRTGLMDSETGRPLDMEYDFKDGKGTATIHRSDGTACTGGASAAMAGSKLMIDQTGDVVCPDGKKFDRSRVECTPGKDGKADCKGQNANTKDGYRVEIVK
jgi:uncharacterized integral membrane protein